MFHLWQHTAQQKSALFPTYFLAYHIDELSGKCQDVSLYLLKLLIQMLHRFRIWSSTGICSFYMSVLGCGVLEFHCHLFKNKVCYNGLVQPTLDKTILAVSGVLHSPPLSHGYNEKWPDRMKSNCDVDENIRGEKNTALAGYSLLLMSLPTSRLVEWHWASHCESERRCSHLPDECVVAGAAALARQAPRHALVQHPCWMVWIRHGYSAHRTKVRFRCPF